jgi:hypothetical protein
MNVNQARDHINLPVIARQDHWGKYVCYLLDIWENYQAQLEKDRWKGKVKIIRCIQIPSQITLDGKGKCYRAAYIPGEVKDFNLSDIAPLGNEEYEAIINRLSGDSMTVDPLHKRNKMWD